LRDTEGTEKRGARQRRRFTREYRREVVQETLAPGASVAGVALRHRLNANLVFTWRRKLLPNLAAVPAKPIKMLPVTITDSGATASVVIAGANAPGTRRPWNVNIPSEQFSSQCDAVWLQRSEVGLTEDVSLQYFPMWCSGLDVMARHLLDLIALCFKIGGIAPDVEHLGQRDVDRGSCRAAQRER
jgi:transposase